MIHKFVFCSLGGKLGFQNQANDLGNPLGFVARGVFKNSTQYWGNVAPSWDTNLNFSASLVDWNGVFALVDVYNCSDSVRIDVQLHCNSMAP